MPLSRYLLVTADDLGIGPATTRGIIELALLGRITGSVLLVNSPYAEAAMWAWRQAGSPADLGWHPCLTLDRPVLPASSVPTLVDDEGRFWSVSRFLKRLMLGRIAAGDVEAELRAQYLRFTDLVGAPPALISAHHHVQIFRTVATALQALLQKSSHLPYCRVVTESWQTIALVPGARMKRLALSWLGRRHADSQRGFGFDANDSLAGITNLNCVPDPDFFVRWLRTVPESLVELTCHPGYMDRTLIGRDCRESDGQLKRRQRELELLKHPSFLEACREAGFTLISPSQLRKQSERMSHAA